MKLPSNVSALLVETGNSPKPNPSLRADIGSSAKMTLGRWHGQHCGFTHWYNKLCVKWLLCCISGQDFGLLVSQGSFWPAGMIWGLFSSSSFLSCNVVQLTGTLQWARSLLHFYAERKKTKSTFQKLCEVWRCVCRGEAHFWERKSTFSSEKLFPNSSIYGLYSRYKAVLCFWVLWECGLTLKIFCRLCLHDFSLYFVVD